jgi:transposase InsO family protein
VLRRLCEKEHIEASEHIVYRYIKYEISQADKDYFRRGKKYCPGHYAPHVNIDYTRFHSMQCAVYDHKTLDFASRVLRGGEWHRARLVLTAATDKRSRLILGWRTDGIPSAVAIIRAARRTAERYGCPGTARFGNGKDFASRWLGGNARNEQRNRIGAAGRKAVPSVMDGLGRPPRFTGPYRRQPKHIGRA